MNSSTRRRRGKKMSEFRKERRLRRAQEVVSA